MGVCFQGGFKVKMLEIIKNSYLGGYYIK